MFKSLPVLIFSLCAVVGADGQTPSLSSVQNPASNIPAALPNGGIAQGSIFVIYGKNLGPASIVQAAALPLPTAAGLGGTTVQVTVNGTTVTAPLVYTLSTQVAGVLPSNTPAGTGTLMLTFNGASGSIPINVVQTNFGISTANESGTGPGVITTPGYALVTQTSSAKPGDTLVIWGTGLGPIQGSDATAPTPVDLGTPIQVYVGGQLANVTYRGRSGFPGLDQINFQIPAAVSGCYVSVVVQTGAMVSNFVTTSVAPNGGACSDSNGLSGTTLGGLGASGTIRLGVVSLYQTTTTTPAIGPIPATTTTSSGAGALFYRFTAQQFAASGNLSGYASIGGCLVSQFSYSGSPTTTPVSVTATGLNAGASIGIAGPLNLTLNPLAGQTGLYGAAAMSALPAGTYTVSNGAGGSDVGSFMATTSLPASLVWTNQSSTATVVRSKGVTLTWSGGDQNSYVVITGSSFSGTSSIVGASFSCTAPVSAGQFTVPTAVLLSLPPSQSIGGIAIGGALGLGAYSNPVKFTAPGLDYGYIATGSSSGASVVYQ